MRYDLSILLILLVYGCVGGQTGQEKQQTKCTEEITSSSLNELTSLGFSAAELFQKFDEPKNGVLWWSQREENDRVTVFIKNPSNTASFVDRSPKDRCNDHLEINVTLDLTTESSLLAESILATLQASTLEEARLSATTPLNSIQGTYDASEIDIAIRRDALLTIDISFKNETVAGIILLEPANTNQDEDVLVSSEIASWQ